MSGHKKCPFCGGDPEPHSYISTKNFVLCGLCRNGTAMYEKMSDAWEAWDRRDDVAVKAAAAGPWRTDWANVPHGTILRKWENGTVDVGEGYPHVNKNLRLVAWAEINTEGL